MTPVIFNHNNIICENKEEAIQVAKSTSLAANEPISVRYRAFITAPRPDNPDQTYQKEVIRTIVAIGTGYADNPVEIINDLDISKIQTYERSLDEPENKSLMWIDTTPAGIDFESKGQESNLVKILKMINTLCNRMDRVEFAFKYGIQCGTTANSADRELVDFRFTGNKPMTFNELVDYNADEDNQDDYSGISKVYDDDLGSPENWVSEIFPNLTHLGIKHDTLANMEKYIPKEYELVWCDDKPGLYIGVNGKYVQVAGATASIINPDGSQSETDDPDNIEGKIVEYIDFKTTDENVTVRMRMRPDGTLKTYNAAEDDETITASPGTASSYKGLMISMIYGGAEGANASTYGVCSHSFIELYNGSNSSINLRGMSLQIGRNGTTWQKVNLVGIVPAKHCFLVRCNQCSSLDSGTTIVKIDKYDMDCPDITFSCYGVKVYLCIGTTVFSKANPYAETDKSNYIDFVGIGRRLKSGESASNTNMAVDAFEGTVMPRLLQETMGAFRVNMDDRVNAVSTAKIKGGDSNDNNLDWSSFDYLHPILVNNPATVFKPWTREDGVKDMYYNRVSFSEEGPNMVTVALGNAPGRRTFNWLSVDENPEFLYLKKSTDAAWKTYESGKQMENQRVLHPNGQSTTTHRVIVGGLTAGTYIYKVGREGFMSVEHAFEVRAEEADRAASFKFVQVTDQQGWCAAEYEPWKYAGREVLKVCNGDNDVTFPNGNGATDGIHFVVNTGDMSQNGTRPSEWLNYYNAAPWLANVAQMNTVGNNDLCPDPLKGTGTKISSTSFVYYYTYELDSQHPQYASNGELMRSCYAFDYGCVHFVVFNSNEWIEDQIQWFQDHMADMEAKWTADPSTRPAWKIAIFHDAPLALTVDNDTAHAKTPGSDGLRNSPLNNISSAVVENRFKFSRLLSQYGFQMSLSGHKHTYTRTHQVKENEVASVYNGMQLPVDYLNPLRIEGVRTTLPDGSYQDAYVDTEKTKGYFINVMCQATGYKLESNKDVPAQDIAWLGKYFPGSTTTGKSVKTQKFPTYTEWTITPTQIKVVTRQVKNLCNGGKLFDAFGTGCNSAEGFTKLDQITSSVIDTVVLTKSNS